MTESYDVLWAQVAEVDLRHIIQYIQANSPTNAEKILSKIKQAVDNLNHFPERGRIVPELQSNGVLLYRELIIAPWRILYRISAHQVYILSVIDSRQNMEDLLLNRFIRTD